MFSGAQGRRRWWWLVVTLLGAVVSVRGAAWLAPDVVERLYARQLFPWLVTGLTRLSSLLSFSLVELLLFALLAVVAVRTLARALRRHPARERQPPTGGSATRLRVLGAFLVPALPGAYLLFLLVWGLNYDRWPAARLFGLDSRGGDAGELAALGAELAQAAAGARASLAEDAAGVVRADAADVLRRAPRGYATLAAAHPWLPRLTARPKALISSGLFSRLGITGLYMPFTGEAHVNVDAPAMLWPATACHELAHQRGLAREDEASFVGYLAGRAHPDPDFRYSAAFDVLGDVLSALADVDPEGARGAFLALDPGVRRDFLALTAWTRRHTGPARSAARSLNDAYLRAQGQADGVRSYGRVVDLLLAEQRQRLAWAAAPLRPGRPTASAAR